MAVPGRKRRAPEVLGRAAPSPERRLWASVLLTQVDDLCAGNPAVRSEAAAWFGRRDFGEVCHLAGLDPDAVRDRLRGALAATGAMPRGRGWSVPVCAVPACGQRLKSESVAGVCWRHMHAPGVCRCLPCRRQAAADGGEAA